MKASSSPSSIAVSVAGLSLLVATGCRCAQDRPYTPFHIEPKKPVPSATASVEVPLPSASAEAPKATEAAVAPKDVSEWTLEGVVITAAPERVIERGLAADFDGDGQNEAVAWTRARSEPADSATSGELIFVSAKTPAGVVLAKIPPFVPAGPGCHHTVSLARTGPRTVTLDVRARCEAALLPRSPTRGVTVLAPGADRPAVLTLRVADPAPGEAMSLSVDSADRDGDGRDDVRLTAAVAPEGEALDSTADLVFLDRTAGPSRDATEPAHSLGAIASLSVVRASGKTTSQKVPARVANARRLYATLCAESGTPRIFDGEGASFSCTGIDAALATLLTAEVHALIARRDALGATAALGRDGWYGPALSSKQRAALEKAVLAAWPKRSAAERAVDPLPRGKSGLPRWSPLAFDGDGTLLVETQDGVSRVHPEDFRSESDATAPWPLAIGAGAAPRWTGIAFPCERSELLLLESDATGTPLPSKPTRLLAPRPGPCRHAAPLPTPSLAPAEWTDVRQAGFIGGGLFGANELAELGASPVRGSPRSPDGKHTVAATALGLVVAGPKSELWSVQDGASLSDCVVANGPSRVACIRGDHAVLITPEAPVPPVAKTR